MIMPSRSTRNRAFLLSAALATASFSGTTLAEELRLITWGGYAPDDVVAQFEEETGIDVQVTLSNNEDMISKLRATGGAGFDLAQPSQDRVVGVQRRVVEADLTLDGEPRCAPEAARARHSKHARRVALLDGGRRDYDGGVERSSERRAEGRIVDGGDGLQQVLN